MKKDRIIIPAKMQVVNIRTIKGTIENDDGADADKINGYTFNHSMGSGIAESEKLIVIQLTVEIEALDVNEKPVGIRASYTHDITFLVENLEDFLEPNENEGEPSFVDSLMVATLTGIAYSTIRGIIYTRTQGTSLNSVILPVIDPKMFSPEPLKSE